MWMLEYTDMAKVYLIGGAPRIGKSTIMQKAISQRPMHAVSTDAVREVLKGVLSEADHPELFKSAIGQFDGEASILTMKNQPESLVSHYLRHFEVVWKSVNDLVVCNMNNERDTIIEGTAILPHNVASLPYDNKAVFVVNLEDQTEVMSAHAQENSHDWLNLYDEEVTVAFARLTQELNKYYYQQAQQYGLPIVLIKNDTFKSDIDKAVAALLS
jgi:2-phosphoglycerate kinase